MKNMLIDFYNDKRTTWLANFCEYFNLDFKDTENYFNSVDVASIDTDKVVKDLGIDLIKSCSSNIKIRCRHMTTLSEKGLENIKKYGLLDLKKMLQLDTTLSEFLNKYKISVDIDNKLILICDNKYLILSN